MPKIVKRQTARVYAPLNISPFEVLYFAVEYGRDVVSDTQLFPFEPAQIERNRTIALLLGIVHRLFGQSEYVARARLDFHKTIRPLFEGNDIRLAERGHVISLENTVSALF